MAAGQVQNLLQMVHRRIGRTRPSTAEARDSIAQFIGTIEKDIVPKLFVAQSAPRLFGLVRPRAVPPVVIWADEAVQFAESALKHDAHLLLRQVEQLLTRGIAVETILLDLLGPASRHLGVMWEEDRCDFVQVTMGLWRLQEIVHTLGASVPGSAIDSEAPRSILLGRVPGEQHGFGLVLVEEFFRRAGWSTLSADAEADVSDFAAMVRAHAFDAIGLTAATDRHIGPLPAQIAAIRSASRNQDIFVMLGGRIFVEDQTLAHQLGADGTAVDARDAVVVAEQWVTAHRPAATFSH